MCKYLEINHMQIYFALLLMTLNVPLRTGKCTPGGTPVLAQDARLNALGKDAALMQLCSL